MGKTKYWLSILAISVVLIAGSLAVSPIAIADDDDDDDDDDEPAKRAFEFEGATSTIEMEGDGDWVKSPAGIIDAEGDFTLSSGMEGEWEAKFFYTSGSPLSTIPPPLPSGSCPPCTTTSTGPFNVVFNADFEMEDGTVVNWDVVVGTGDIRTGNDPTFENFWVQANGFGTATSEFSDDD